MSIGKPHGFDDFIKKRRFVSESSTSESDTSARDSLGKPKKKAMKPECLQDLEQSLPTKVPVKTESTLLVANSQFNAVSQSTSKCVTRKDPKNVPIYKKILFTDSPVSNDPYAIPDTPGSFPKKSKAKAAVQLSRKVDDEFVKTPELPHNKQKRHTTSSPHPGAQLKKDAKPRGSNSRMSTPSMSPSSPSDVLFGTDMSVPEVGFNASPARRLNSSKSYVNLFKMSASLSTPVRVPEKTRSLLKSSGISTSSLRLRRPIEIDFGEDESVVNDQTSRSTKMSSDIEGDNRFLPAASHTTPPERRILSRESPFRRQRSTSVGSLQNLTVRSNLPHSDSTPKKKARSRSVERSPPISSRILRATPERMRHRSESHEQSNLKKSASDRDLFSKLNNHSQPKLVVCETKNVVKSKTETVKDAKHLEGDDVPSSSQESVYHSSTSSPNMTKHSVISTSIERSAKNDGVVEDDFFSTSSSPLKIEDKSPMESVGDLLSRSQEIEVVFENIQSPSKEPTFIDGESSSDVYCSQDSDVVPCSQEILGDYDIPYTEEVVCVNEGEMFAPLSQDINLSSDSNCNSPAEITRQPLKSALRSPGKENLKAGRRIQFSNLQVFYFGRIQGFHVVPVHGDIALGMEYEHFGSREFKVLKSRRPSINIHDPEESELSEGEDPGAESFIRRRDFEKDNFERQRILQYNGVTIERQKQETEVIRKLRKNCGCSCRGGICRPNICECSRSGVPCQVDRQEEDGRYFPCTCIVASLCNNTNGRLVYDYEKVNESRRSTIQRWRDMQRTGIFASPSVKRFENDDEDVVPDSQGEQQQEEDESGFKSSPTREDFLLDEPRQLLASAYSQATETPPEREGTPTQRKFFPPAPSML